MSAEREPAGESAEERTVSRRPARQRSLTPPARKLTAGHADVIASGSTGTGRSVVGTFGGAGTDPGLAEVLQTEEATRAHGFAAAIALASLSVAAAVPFLGGDAFARWLCLGALLAMGAGSCVTYWLTRPASGSGRYRRALYRAYGWLLVLGVLAVEYYVGFFSPVTVVVTLGIYYLGQSVDRVYSWILPSFAIASYCALATLTYLGVLPDVSLFPAGDSLASSRVFVIAAATGILCITVLLARLSRHALHEAIDASREALLLAQQRGAQLAEANLQLDRALRVAVGKPGRYTGARAGDYMLGLVIGVGAIGEVYEAHHAVTGEPAAVKLLQVDALERHDLVERFLREGELARRVNSPYVTRVFGVGTLDGGEPFLVMELLRGQDLAARLRHGSRMPPSDVVRLAEHVGAALERAHAEGIIHRDLKPLNVYESQQGGKTTFKVLDFGISKLADSSGTLTQQGVVGTPGYMSPEQARGIAVDHRSDLFSLGVLLYRVITGQPAFPGDNTPQIMFDIVYKVPPRPSGAVKDLPREVELVLAIALAKKPEERFSGASELSSALAEAYEGRMTAVLRSRGHQCVKRYPWGRDLAAMHDASASP